MIIREATQTDFQKIATIHANSWKDAYWEILPQEFIEKCLDQRFEQHWKEINIEKDDIVLVAEEESLVGFIAVWCRPTAWIDNLHVLPSKRSNKVGSALMKAVAKALIERGHKIAYLWVFERNKNAIRFYKNLGGKQKEHTMKDIFGNEVLSRKIVWSDLTHILD